MMKVFLHLAFDILAIESEDGEELELPSYAECIPLEMLECKNLWLEIGEL